MYWSIFTPLRSDFEIRFFDIIFEELDVRNLEHRSDFLTGNFAADGEAESDNEIMITGSHEKDSRGFLNPVRRSRKSAVFELMNQRINGVDDYLKDFYENAETSNDKLQLL